MSCSELFVHVLRDLLCSSDYQYHKEQTSEMLSKINTAFQVAADMCENYTRPSMLSRLSSTLQAAANVVAPPCDRIDDFKYHWQQVLQECHRCQGGGTKQLIVSEQTHAPRHLKQMLKVLVQDTCESPTGTTLTPCLEYIIQERILVLLVSFAWSDRPLGIRQYVYMFLSKVLQHLHHSYLHQMRIHKPLQMMIKATCEKKASPYENQEMEFLSIICEKIREDVSIVLLYIEPLTLTGDTPTGFTPDVSGLSTPSRCRLSICEDASSSCSESSTITPSDHTSSHHKIGSKFPLVEALLNLCHSNDTQICAHAHDCLLTLTALQECRSSEAIAKHTLLSHYVAGRLTTTAEAIPLDTEPSLVESISLAEREGPDVSSSDSEGEAEEFPVNFPGKREVTEFLRWVVLFDKLIGGCDSTLGSSICSIVRELFLESFVASHFACDDSEDEDVLALYTALLIKMLLLTSSPMLTNCLVSWLTDDTEEVGGEESMRKILLKRCKQPPHHLQTQSLRLLQVMIEKPGSLAVQVLALDYVCSRSYFDSSAAENQQNSWSDEEDERYKQREEGDITPGSIPVSRTMAPSNINKIVKRFLSLVPEEIRSTSNEDFESYKADALRQYRDVCRRTPYHAWPREAVSMEGSSDSSSTASKESKTEAETNVFYEGPLLSMLLNFLHNLPEQDYDVNLQVTSLVSSLALLPHPHLHEYLLNPTISLSGGVRTLYTVLRGVVGRLQQPIMAREDYRNYLKVTRFQLLGTMEELEYERDEDDTKFEALIVLEEFIKELGAIAYAKYTCEGNLF